MWNILIADDNRQTQQTISAYFKERNLASNGTELERLMDKYDPSLILFDLGFGKENGFDRLRSI